MGKWPRRALVSFTLERNFSINMRRTELLGYSPGFISTCFYLCKVQGLISSVSGESFRRVINMVHIHVSLALPMLRYFCLKHKDPKIFENHLNPVMLEFIRKVFLSTIRWVLMSNHNNARVSGFCIILLVKLATTSIRVYSTQIIQFAFT